MGKKKTPSAPKYQDTTYDTGGLFGTTTTTKNGTSYNPTESISSLANNAYSGINNYLKKVDKTANTPISTDFSKDANYQVYSNNLQRQMRDNFNNNVLSGIANNGLMRSSGLQAATNAFNNTLADQTADLYDSYYNRMMNERQTNLQNYQNSLSNYQNTLNNLYNYLTGVSGLGMQANSIPNNFSLRNYNNQLTQAQNSGNGLMGAITGAMNGASAGSAAGPWGALGGALIGGAGGYMANR